MDIHNELRGWAMKDYYVVRVADSEASEWGLDVAEGEVIAAPLPVPALRRVRYNADHAMEIGQDDNAIYYVVPTSAVVMTFA